MSSSNIIESYNYEQIIKKTTRVTENKESLLDHIIINNKITDFTSQVIDISFSDHQCITIYWNTKEQLNRQYHKTISFRTLKNFDACNFQIDILEADWQAFYSENDPDKCWTILKDNLLGLWNKHAPTRTKRIKIHQNRKPWMNKDIEIAMNRTYDLSTKAKTTKDNEAWKNYKIAKNRVNTLVNRAKYHYYHEKFKNCSSPADVWKPIKNLISKKRRNKRPDPNQKPWQNTFLLIPYKFREKSQYLKRLIGNTWGPESLKT